MIGDALVRMHDFLGHTVIRENHIGDWGRPFGMLIEHLLDLGEDVAADGLSQGDLDGFYKQANAKFAESPEFQDRARERVVLLQRGDEETARLWHRLVDMSTDYFNTVYGKLGVLLTDDDLAGESMYQPLMDRTVERLAETDLLQHSDGALVVFPPGFTNRDGDPLPLIIQAKYGRVQLRHERSHLCARPRGAARRRPDALRRRRTAAAAPADGVRGVPHGRMARAAEPRRCTSRSATCSVTTARCCVAARATP